MAIDRILSGEVWNEDDQFEPPIEHVEESEQTEPLDLSMNHAEISGVQAFSLNSNPVPVAIPNLFNSNLRQQQQNEYHIQSSARGRFIQSNLRFQTGWEAAAQQQLATATYYSALYAYVTSSSNLSYFPYLPNVHYQNYQLIRQQSNLQ